MVFCWGVFVSPNSYFFIACAALALSIITATSSAVLWIFYLSKHFSTHQVKVFDLKRSAEKKKPVTSKSFDIDEETDEEAEATKLAESLTGQMFNRTKEKLTDSLI